MEEFNRGMANPRFGKHATTLPSEIKYLKYARKTDKCKYNELVKRNLPPSMFIRNNAP